MMVSRSRMAAVMALVLVLAARTAMAGEGHKTEKAEKAGLAHGAKAPATDIKLKTVDGKMITLAEVSGTKGTLVVFTCNACPYVKAWEERLVSLGNTYADKGIGVIAINSNDPKVQAGDSYEVMQERARERGMKFPYAMDETSGVARAFGATRTPEVFLFDASGALVYHGAVDDNSGEPDKVSQRYLKDALDAVLAGTDVTVKETKAIGCGIKFRS